MHLLVTKLFAFGSSTFSGCSGWKGLEDIRAHQPRVQPWVCFIASPSPVFSGGNVFAGSETGEEPTATVWL
jgi:hypothetical protein